MPLNLRFYVQYTISVVQESVHSGLRIINGYVVKVEKQRLNQHSPVSLKLHSLADLHFLLTQKNVNNYCMWKVQKMLIYSSKTFTDNTLYLFSAQKKTISQYSFHSDTLTFLRLFQGTGSTGFQHFVNITILPRSLSKLLLLSKPNFTIMQ